MLVTIQKHLSLQGVCHKYIYKRGRTGGPSEVRFWRNRDFPTEDDEYAPPPPLPGLLCIIGTDKITDTAQIPL